MDEEKKMHFSVIDNRAMLTATIAKTHTVRIQNGINKFSIPFGGDKSQPVFCLCSFLASPTTNIRADASERAAVADDAGECGSVVFPLQPIASVIQCSVAKMYDIESIKSA